MAGLPATSGVIVLSSGETEIDAITTLTGDTWIVGQGSTLKAGASFANKCINCASYSLRVSGVKFDGFTTAIYAPTTANTPTFHIDGCEFANFSASAIGHNGTWDSAIVSGNHIHDGTGPCIKLGDGDATRHAARGPAVVSGNLIRGIDAGTGQSIYGVHVNGNSAAITGNSIHGLTGDASAAECHCIYTKAPNSTIVGNSLSGPTTATTTRCVSVKGSARSESAPFGYSVACVGNACRGGGSGMRGESHEIAFVGNVIDDPDVDGIVLATNADGDNAIVGNVIRKSASTNQGVDMSGSGDNLCVANVIEGFSDKVANDGAGEVVASNLES